MATGGCPNCGQNEVVTLKGKAYCGNCGAPMEQTVPQPAPPVPFQAAPINQAPAVPEPAPMPEPAPAPAPAPVAEPAPVPIPDPEPLVPAPEPAPEPMPAPAPAPLPEPPAPAPEPEIPAPTPQPEAEPTPPEPETPAPQPSPPTPVPMAAAPAAGRRISDLRKQPAPGAKPAGQIIDLRQNQAKRPTIAAVANSQVASPRIDLIAPVAKKEQRTQTAQTTVKHDQVQKFQAKPEPAPQAAKPAGVLPNAAASVHQAMQKLVKAIPTPEIAHTAIPTESRPPLPKAGMVAAAFVLVGLGTYTWVTNYPKMAVKLAGGRAGVEASYPSFLPASFKLSGAVAYGAGEVSYRLSSGDGQSLRITQKRTTWDSRTLLENHVKSKTEQPLTLTGQGLTVYLYDSNATWVNHGIWYTLEGTDRLNREQILKIAFSL